MKDRRIGKFSLPQHWINHCPEQARAALRDVIVLRAEFMAYKAEIDYIGIHPAFATKPDGAEPQEYIAEITTKGDGTVQSMVWKAVP